ncbi:MAG TPA: COX15/CtaA family protein [Gammaproteobacteria bacterium]|nr:COX15/CtaA family protein [Gammaproteobacteria bacterium]
MARTHFKNSFLANLSLSASIFALCVIALGAFTRLIDAGLGCPDWPGCYGHIIVPAHDSVTSLIVYKAWAEMIHRYFVGGLSILILTIIVLIFGKKSLRFRSNIIFAICLIALLSYQIMLGQWTVTLKLLPIIVTQHLLGGYLILSILWLIFLNNSLNQKKSHVKNILPWAVLGLIFLLLQITLGAWTSTNYASLSCTDFPLCVNDQAMHWHFKEAFNLFSPAGINYEGGVLPAIIRQTIQMLHRLGALILIFYWLVFFAMANLKLKHRPDLLKIIYIILGLLCVQLSLGISNVIFQLPLIIALSHTVVAALLLISSVTLIFRGAV